MPGFEQHLGLLASLPHGAHRVLVMEPRQREDGCTVIPLGSKQGGDFNGLGHIYLTPDERETLIAALMKHRKVAPGDGVAGRFDAWETESLVITAAELHSGGDADLSTSQEELAEEALGLLRTLNEF
ncbi:hypothetical protein I0C86_41125 [Plantactinospora sp. S1510]|uniref:Uncharacterized protein n=1 Tax=Plantactinospora alkalitolerans TaxID=2789879 RepID=A0ABS0HA04_9ACTN|nr:hypothetical protein [Plantactinospora alkalitolerans]MBF9135255.1 hypothetical protein [Plantactinospora alkalitolerans]